MRVEVRNYTDGAVEAIVRRDDGAQIAAIRVKYQGHNEQREVYEVTQEWSEATPGMSLTHMEHAWLPIKDLVPLVEEPE